MGPWLDIIGWLGSALLVYSVMQTRVLPFRVLNLAACAVLTAFNAVLGIWPMVAMNLALSAINLWHLRLLLTSQDKESGYAVLEVGIEDAYLHHILETHEADIRTFQPDLTPGLSHAMATGGHAFVIQRGDETAGAVLVKANGPTATVLLDYVTPRFRDFSPSRLLWRRDGALAKLGITNVETSPNMVDPYYSKVGFSRRDDGSFELDLACA